MSRTPLAGRHAVAIGLGLPLSVGVFYLPSGVENIGGPGTPLAYLAATLAVCAVAVAYAVYLSTPLADRDGLAYLAVSRTWGSRSVGFLAVWPAVGGYVAALAVLVDALGRPLAATTPLSPTLAALLVLAAVVAVHALGPSVAGRVQLAVTGALLVGLGLGVAGGMTAVAPDNFVPLFPTTALRASPLRSLGEAALLAALGFVGVDAAAGVSAVVRAPRRTAPRAMLVAVLVAGTVATLAATVTVGVIPWTRLVFLTAPFADAVASAFDRPVGWVLGPGRPLALVGAALAVTWLPARTLRGVGELVPGLDRETRSGVPDPALAVTGVLAAGLVVLDATGYGLYLFLTGALLQYACLSASAATLPLVRPDLRRRCRFRPPTAALVGIALVGAATAALALWYVLGADPATTLAVSRLAPATVGVSDAVLVRPPPLTVVPALLGWELVGITLLAVAVDYRAERGVDLPSLAAVYEE